MDTQPYSAGEASLLVVRGHAQGLDKELDSLVNAVLIVQTEASHVQSIPIGRVHPQDITVANKNKTRFSEGESCIDLLLKSQSGCH